MDIILFQLISGGWEFLFTASDGMIYRSFHREPTLARTRLLRQLGWDKRRFDSAESDFRRF